MSRRKKNYIEENVEITGFAAEGKAFGKINNKIVFVPYAAPGDVVDVRIIRNKSSFLEGRIERLVKSSSIRCDTFCSHFGTCGGCRWQHIPYEKQLEYKQQQVIEQLKHIGQIVPEITMPIMGSAATTEYRNKLEFTFSPRGWLTTEQLRSGIAFGPAVGFHMPGQFDKVLNLEQCRLQPDVSDRIRHAVKQFACENSISFHNLISHEGLLRTMTVRIAGSGEIMLVIQFFYEDEESMEKMQNFIFESFGEVSSVAFIVNTKLNDSFEGVKVHRIYGSEYITETMDGLQFRIGPLTFFQTNSSQALEMYRTVRNLCQLTGKETVYDLYTGTGTIANFLAPHTGNVIGVEYIAEATEHAKVNAAINGISNTRFFHGDMKDVLTSDFFNENGMPDVIVTDPPRAGMHPEVVNKLLKSDASRIIYVSCNPATQARDLKILNENYAVIKIQPIDMFPHTYHVENIALLQKRR
jgi:23S rRNA (uracil1939-C5)-methyltransferase